LNQVVSWDGYGYVLPLPESLQRKNNPWYFGVPQPTEGLESVDPNLKAAYEPFGLMYMNRNGVEARTGCSMQASGLVLHNPCRYIRIAHWHCDLKTHTAKNRSDKGDIMTKINEYVGEQEPTFGEKLPEFFSCSHFDVGISCLNSTSPSSSDDDCGGIYLGEL
jgi:hypothetical protein